LDNFEKKFEGSLQDFYVPITRCQGHEDLLIFVHGSIVWKSVLLRSPKSMLTLIFSQGSLC